MFGIENLTPAQRQALMFGVPAVAALAVGVAFGKRGEPKAPADESGGENADATATPRSTAQQVGMLPAASTDVLGVGQLMEFESVLTNSINALHQKLEDRATAPTNEAPPRYPDKRPGTTIGACPQDYTGVVNSEEGWWSCMTQAQYKGLLGHLELVRAGIL